MGSGHALQREGQGVEFRRQALLLLGAVDLVDDDAHFLAALAQILPDLLVLGMQPGAAVDDEQDQIRPGHGLTGLFENADLDLVAGVGNKPAGVDEHVGTRFAAHLAEDAVPGHSGHVVGDGDPLLDEAVEKGGFAHVGTPDEGHHGKMLVHGLRSWPMISAILDV